MKKPSPNVEPLQKYGSHILIAVGVLAALMFAAVSAQGRWFATNVSTTDGSLTLIGGPCSSTQLSVVQQLFSTVTVPVGNTVAVTCDATGNVTDISAVFQNLTGTFHAAPVQALDHLSSFVLKFNQLSGSLPISQLPASMQKFVVYQSGVSGPLAITQLPAGLTDFNVSGNQFSGPFPITQLPATLRVFDVSGNRFTGALPITQLPSGLTEFSVQGNLFSGPFPITTLPATLGYFNLAMNQFSGPFPIEKLPAAMYTFKIGVNHFTGAFLVTQLPSLMSEFDVSYNSFSGPLSISTLPQEMTYFTASFNSFTGPMKIVSFPWKMWYFDVGFNMFSGPVPVTALTAPNLSVILVQNCFDAPYPSNTDYLKVTPQDPGKCLDHEGPIVTISSPVDGTLSSASPILLGTAADAGTGVAGVTLTYTCDGSALSCFGTGTKLYWSGTAWTATPTTLTATCSGQCVGPSVPWGYESVPSNKIVNLKGEKYTVTVQATDAVGNAGVQTATWISGSPRF